MTNVNGVLYFSATNGSAVNGQELWKSDGTDAGTTIVKDINARPANGSFGDFYVVNNTLFLLLQTLSMVLNYGKATAPMLVL